MKNFDNTETLPLQNALHSLYEKKHFLTFDIFFTGKMLESSGRDFSQSQRRDAFQIFHEKTKGEKIASVPTMQRWFGLGGYTEPQRKQIFEIAFALSLTVEELNNYLTEGIFAPAIQVNDYQEIIFWYGLENNLSYDKCMDMIQSFQQHLSVDFQISHSCRTDDLLHQFQLKRHLPPHTFMEWMMDHAYTFKGYSNTTLNYLVKYKKIILAQVRKEAKDCLETMLLDTGYASWKSKRHFRKRKEGELIRKYIYHNHTLTKEQRKEILDQVSFVYFEEDSNVRLLSELYSSHSKMRNSRHSPFRRMTEKYISDLLNIATQKEREIRTAQAESCLERMENSEELCPDWIADLIREYAVGDIPESVTVKWASQWISQYRREHKRRLIQIERADILPFVQYVAGHHYMASLEQQSEEYRMEDARKQFVELADQTLTACNMARFSEDYELDAILLTCFQKEEWYLYAEALELVTELRGK